MFFALDENNIRVNAEDGEFKHCVCPACGSPVIQRRGDTNRHHFAHDPRKRNDVKCPYDYNADYKNMSEWHIRMQEYFPKEEREYIFTDKATGEKHIADVFIKEANTVLEFQYSSLKQKEFLDRTMFHLNEGRRLVWLFDESWKDADDPSYNKQYHKNGKLDKASNMRAEGPYTTKSYKWLYRRKIVEAGPPVYQQNYSVCLYTGAEGDTFHRIISQQESSIIVSLHDITMSNKLNVEDLFALETIWQEQEPWKSEFESMTGLRPFWEYSPPDKNNRVKTFEEEIMEIAEARRLHAEAVRRKQAEKEALDRENYWKAVLEDYEGRDKKSKKKW